LADGCVLCRGVAGDAELGREQIWEDGLWRLTMSVGPGEERTLPSGATALVSKDYPEIDEGRLRAVADTARELLSR
jgi:hypothetical protein